MSNFFTAPTILQRLFKAGALAAAAVTLACGFAFATPNGALAVESADGEGLMAGSAALVAQNSSTSLFYDNFEYYLKSGKAYITAYSKVTKTITVPAELDGHPVVGIDSLYNDEATKVVIPSSVTRIGWDANGKRYVNPFADLPKLKTIVLEDGVKGFTVKSGVLFANGGKLLLSYPAGMAAKSYSVPAGVTTVAKDAFVGAKFTTLKLPASVKNLNARSVESDTKGQPINPIVNCPKLKAVNVASANKWFKSIGGVLYSKDGKILYGYPICKTGTHFKMPATVKTIAHSACFSAKFAKVTISKNCTQVCGTAFQCCAKLKALVFPDKVKTIGTNAYGSCTALKSVTYGASVTTLGKFAAQFDSKLTKAVLKSKKLAKGGGFNTFVGTGVSKIIVQVGTAKENKTYAKKYNNGKYLKRFDNVDIKAIAG